MSEGKIYRLLSNEWVNTPGIVRMARNEYAFGGKQARWAVDLLAETYFKGDKVPAKFMLENPEACKIDNGMVIVDMTGGDE